MITLKNSLKLKHELTLTKNILKTKLALKLNAV